MNRFTMPPTWRHGSSRLFDTSAGRFSVTRDDAGRLYLLAWPPHDPDEGFGEELLRDEQLALCALLLATLNGTPSAERVQLMQDTVAAIVRWQQGDSTLGDVVQTFERLGMFGTLALQPGPVS